MDIFNFAKAVEQGIYDVMLWVFFYPYTLVRMILRPAQMLAYVRAESSKNPETAFGSAMRPALFLFISILIGALLQPLNVGEIKTLETSRIGALIAQSFFALLLFRMVSFSVFPLIGAVLYDWLTPGQISRDTMRTPFHQQCYICAPFALIESPALSSFSQTVEPWVLGFALLAVLWFLVCQVIFFRQIFSGRPLVALARALAVFIGGWITAILVSWVVT